MTSETLAEAQPMSLSSSQEQLTDHENMHVENEPDSETTTVNTSDNSDTHKDVSVHYNKSTSTSNGTTFDNIKTTDSKTFSQPGGHDDLVDPECHSLSTQGGAATAGMSYLQENGVQETAESITEPVLSVRMLMSSRVSVFGGVCVCSCQVHYSYTLLKPIFILLGKCVIEIKLDYPMKLFSTSLEK